MDLELLTTTYVDTWVMVLVVSILTISLLIGVPLARSAGRRRGIRLANPGAYATRADKAKDTGLFLAALIPTLLVWLAVMGVSFIGLTGFANDVMGWNHWTNVLVPLSLDGISISFGAWAFVAVKRGRHPGRAYKIVLAAATVSATLNFVHGRDKWSIWAGLYLAFLSFAGMAMFHELLDQFMAGYDDEVALKTRYPRFGQRWFYAPISTFSARRAWIVHPPAEGLRPSVRNALTHLEDTREAKRQRRLYGAQLVREEQQAKLVEVHARAEVRRARSASWRSGAAPGTVPPVSHQPMPHQPVSHQNGHQPNGHHQNGHQFAPQSVYQPMPQPEALPEPPPALHEPEPVSQDLVPERDERGTILGRDLRATLESVLSAPTGREPMGHRPLSDTSEITSRGMLNHLQEPVQRMIAEAESRGEPVSVAFVREWTAREYGRTPGENWARNQIKAVRQRDSFGVDADLA
ncbi:DUF2637 domain-containing protein [Catellatospora citrea]|uniref:DUF2637 domain-containing protein n=1 Tax=Catellatospora citrea TaxID=53366 RepID=A0A8J3KD91_9ACTN|nr:DUF2637 domain-containing protein [Catellatospora citrea]RKE06920.1 uncharacterized protein DUF2637 [Catellatospora citrea]GIF95070.1 hypothetical protein Cci01nite_01640 [Catellatospora citrea]